MESATHWMWHVPQPSSTYLNQFAPSEQGPCMGGATSLCRYFHAPSYPLIFTWELHVDAKSTQYTELTVLSPSMFWHVEGQDPPIHKRGVGIKRTGEEIEASYHSGLPAVGCPTAFEVYSKSQLLPSCSWVHLKTFKNFLYILAALLVVEYIIIWIISTSVFIYLLLDLNHSLLFPLLPLSFSRMYCMQSCSLY